MKRIRLGALGALLLLLSGCGAARETADMPRYTLGVALKTLDSEHWLRIRAGMERAASDLNVRLLLTWPSGEMAADEQQVMISDLVRQTPDALIVSPCDSWRCATWSEAAAAQGIRVLTMDTAALDCTLPYLGSDNALIGRTAADYLRAQHPRGGKIGIITGNRRQQTVSDRCDAFAKALAEPGETYTLLPIQEDCQSFAEALRAARALMDEGADGIFCTSAVLGLGAAAAQQELGTAVQLVAVDTQDDALKAVQTGALDALITQSGYDIGYRAVSQAVAHLESGAPLPPRTIVPGELLTADNIERYVTEGSAWQGS